VPSVLINFLCNICLLLGSVLLRLSNWYSDLVHIILERGIQSILVISIEFLGFRYFLENPDTNERNEITFEINLSNISFLNDLLVSYILVVIE